KTAMKKTSTISALLFAIALLIASCGGGGSSGGADGNLYINPDLLGGAIQSGDLGMADSSAVTVSTFAGDGTNASTNGTGTAAQFGEPTGIATDGENLYVCDSGTHTIRKVNIASKEVTTVAGSAGLSGTLDGTGSAARFNRPWYITTDGVSLYVSEPDNHTIRKIDIASGTVTTLAGKAGVSGTINGTGTEARFDAPLGLTNDGTNIYVADGYNNKFRKIVIATGEVTDFAGLGDSCWPPDALGDLMEFACIVPLDIIPFGSDFYYTNYAQSGILKMEMESGTIQYVSAGDGWVDGVYPTSRTFIPYAITTDGVYLYISDTFNLAIRRINTTTTEITTIAGDPTNIDHLEADGAGNEAKFGWSYGITTDGKNIYFTDRDHNRIRKISP
ncbi:MAG: hypothetical protein KAR06_01285, partial [Deltaproteobacteria bacterium]|nr:hypothetical protein [Deltaproteobacteria bacterium]